MATSHYLIIWVSTANLSVDPEYLDDFIAKNSILWYDLL